MSKAPEIMDKLREYIATLPQDMTFVQDLKAHCESTDFSEEIRLKMLAAQCNDNEFAIVMLDGLIKSGEDKDPRTRVIVGWDDHFRKTTNDMMTDDDRSEIDAIVERELDEMEKNNA